MEFSLNLSVFIKDSLLKEALYKMIEFTAQKIPYDQFKRSC